MKYLFNWRVRGNIFKILANKIGKFDVYMGKEEQSKRCSNDMKRTTLECLTDIPVKLLVILKPYEATV